MIFSALPEGKQIDLPRETMAASWDHERSVTQVFALIASLFLKKTIFIHSSNLHYTQRTSVIEQLYLFLLQTRYFKRKFISALIFKVSIRSTGFLLFWYLCNVLKGILRKKLDSDILTTKNLALKFPLQPRPMKLTVSQCQWVVTPSQELPNLAGSGNCCFFSG